MHKFAEEQIKLAHLSGATQAMSQFGLSAQTTYAFLLEKGASADEAEMLMMKQAAGTVSKILGWVGKKLPALGKWLRGGKELAKEPGFVQGALHRGGEAFSTASKGMKDAPGETLWSGVQNYGKGLIGGGSGVGGGLGRATLVGGAGYGLLGGGNEPRHYSAQPPNYGG